MSDISPPGGVDDHAEKDSEVHGVGGSTVESVSGAQSKADSAEANAKAYTDDHEAKSNPHGITTPTQTQPKQVIGGFRLPTDGSEAPNENFLTEDEQYTVFSTSDTYNIRWLPNMVDAIRVDGTTRYDQSTSLILYDVTGDKSGTEDQIAKIDYAAGERKTVTKNFSPRPVEYIKFRGDGNTDVNVYHASLNVISTPSHSHDI